ncbi:MAG: Maf family protein [Lachnospiraceae bacterium]
MRTVILASGSPRRRDILGQAGISFTVRASDKEEIITKEAPQDAVEELSRQKALDIAEHLVNPREYLIIGADTIVAFQGMKFGKPKDEEDAKRMLKLMQGNTHQVYTGVTLVYDKDDPAKGSAAMTGVSDQGPVIHTFYAVTDVVMVPMADAEIEAYVRTGEPMDKAGAYAIQGRCAAYIKEIHGEYNNVVGLPIARMMKEIKELGIIL